MTKVRRAVATALCGFALYSGASSGSTAIVRSGAGTPHRHETPRLRADTVRNPCWAWVFKATPDSVYAELQAPRGLKVCKNVELQGIP